MEHKRAEYFQAGVQQVWMVDPETRTVHVYDSPEEHVALGVNDTLSGGPMLPGFEMKLQELFAELDRRADA
jgi:Uma2 family endonuclease